MKPLLLFLSIILLSIPGAYAQTTRDVSGAIADTTKQTLPGSSVKLVSNTGDSTLTIADANGKFNFPGVKGSKITLTISSIGFTAIKKHFALDDNDKPVDLGMIILKAETNVLNQVNIVGAANPITLKEDTVVYNAAAYKVRENAPTEDLIKKLPGVDVDVNGNITTQGKQVTKVRINGKDYMGGDVQSATKNLPADIIENIQMIDDYGDQANLTGIKTGDPTKVMNITIRKDKNYGYTAQATAGDGKDALPQDQGVPNKNRYIGSLNVFNFHGDQQIAVQGSINNTNVNTFSFGTTGSGGGGGFGGGGGRGNAGRGGANSGSLITAQNGITDAKSIGVNFRDQWGKSLGVYGSYSFADNTTTTSNNIFQQNTSSANPSQQQQKSLEKDENINHRFNWNMEYKPDTVNYLKVTPTFSYGGTNTNESDAVSLTRQSAVTSAYTSVTNGDSQAPNYGITALFNHRFKHRRNLSIFVSASSAPSWAYQNPVYNYTIYTADETRVPDNQTINTYSRTNSYGVNLSYLEPLGKRSYLEFNYALNHSVTINNKETDTLSSTGTWNQYDLLSNKFNYTFTTNKVGLNYRFIEKKYNYTLGLGVQPSTLDGNSLTEGIPPTHKNTFNIIPTARFIYNYSRSKAFSINYNGSNAAPTFSQLQPVVDFSNATYPVEGNPELKPAFTNNISIRYNNFSFATGNVFFANFTFQKIQNQVVTNTITSSTSNRIFTQYLNADGFYNLTGRVTYAKPWAERKYSLIFNGTAQYNNNVGYLTNVNTDPLLATPAEITAAQQKNIAKNLVFTPEVRFRVDLTNIIDAQILTNYTVNRTTNSVKNDFNDGIANVRTWNIGLNGKNYFGDWVFSYDFTKATNYGYASTIQVTNPNILNLYVERRFLKNKVATVRLSGFDLFNQNTGFTSTTTASSITQSSVNRLARYYLLTFTLRLQKFAGKAPTQDIRGERQRGERGGPGGGGPGGGGPGGPGGGGPGIPQ